MSTGGRIGRTGLVLLPLAAVSGCVERTMKIRSDPPGAVVVVNDEEVGVTPAQVSFLWYGDYEIILRRAGYQTLRTHHRVHPPWYQLPPFDFFAEVLWPGMISDRHELPEYVLQPLERPRVEDLVQRAAALRDQALYTAGE